MNTELDERDELILQFGSASIFLEEEEEEEEEARTVVSLLDITERKRAEEELHKRLKELEIFNRISVGRELKMIELKKEINELLEKYGKESKYKIAE